MEILLTALIALVILGFALFYMFAYGKLKREKLALSERMDYIISEREVFSEILEQFGEKIGNINDIDTFMDVVIESLANVMRSRKGCIMVYDTMSARDGGILYRTINMDTRVEESYSLDGKSLRSICDNGEPTLTSEYICVPIKMSSHIAGIIYVAEKDSGKYSGKDLQLLNIIANQISIVLERTLLTINVERKYLELSGLQQITSVLSSVKDIDEILTLIMNVIGMLTNVKRYGIFLYENSSGELKEKITRNLGYDDIVSVKNFHNILGKEGIVEDVPNVEILSFAGINYTVMKKENYSIVNVPLVVGETAEVIGILVFSISDEKLFLDREQNVIPILVNQIAIAIYNANLYGDLMEKERLEREVEIAENIQTGVLPKIAPDIEELEIGMRALEARNVGGDFYDFIKLDDDRLAFCIGDVAGTGMKAALLMLMTRSIVQAAARKIDDPDELIEYVNSILNKDMDSEMFITLLYGVFDLKKRTLNYTNAGHMFPFYYNVHSGEQDFLTTSGISIGMEENMSRHDMNRHLTFKNGDIILFYTDGIIEAIDRSGEQFGFERFTEQVIGNAGLGMQDIIDTVFNTVLSHCQGQERVDDIALIGFKVKN